MRCAGDAVSFDQAADDIDWGWPDLPPTTTEKGYSASWERLRRWCVERHIESHGNVCPGFQVPAHESYDLTGHHIVAISDGGESVPANVAILCRSCNSREAAYRRRPWKRCPDGHRCNRPPDGSFACCGDGAAGR